MKEILNGVTRHPSMVDMEFSGHLYLTGYRGTGKSSVAAILSGCIDRQAIDLDAVIVADAGQSIRQIFDDGGEPLFRDLESAALRRVATERAAIIALGGGAILSAANRRVIRATGRCFWLDADAETILERLRQDPSTADSRPALTPLDQLEEIRQLLDQRRELYREVSQHRIDTRGKSTKAVAREILRILER